LGIERALRTPGLLMDDVILGTPSLQISLTPASALRSRRSTRIGADGDGTPP
jgi:hypothetical protein